MSNQISIQVVLESCASKVDFSKVMEMIGVLLVAEVVGFSEYQMKLVTNPDLPPLLTLQILSPQGEILLEGRGRTEEECSLSFLEAIGKKFALVPRTALPKEPLPTERPFPTIRTLPERIYH